MALRVLLDQERGGDPMSRRQETPHEDFACAVCGRFPVGRSLSLGGRAVCGVCEGITVRLAPGHPLYRTWVRRIARLVQVDEQ